MTDRELLLEAAKQCHEGRWSGGLYLIGGFSYGDDVGPTLGKVVGKAWGRMSRDHRVMALLLARELLGECL